MHVNEFAYLDMVKALTKTGADIAETIDPDIANMLHHTLGVAGEAGEIVDVVKKHAIYGLQLDRDHLIEELGDIEFYLAGLRDTIGVTRKTVVECNQRKLAKRYPQGQYSDDDAEARADKDDEQ